MRRYPERIVVRRHATAPKARAIAGDDGVRGDIDLRDKDIADARSRMLAAKSPEETIQAANQHSSGRRVR